ncbi:hypothetical protein STEG23_018567, partial [Scotinomys teguina]
GIAIIFIQPYRTMTTPSFAFLMLSGDVFKSKKLHGDEEWMTLHADDSKGDSRVYLVLTVAFATVTGISLTQPAPQRGTFKENNCQTKDNAELLGKRRRFLSKEYVYCYCPPLPLVLPVSAIQRQCLYWFEAGEKQVDKKNNAVFAAVESSGKDLSSRTLCSASNMPQRRADCSNGRDRSDDVRAFPCSRTRSLALALRTNNWRVGIMQRARVRHPICSFLTAIYNLQKEEEKEEEEKKEKEREKKEKEEKEKEEEEEMKEKEEEEKEKEKEIPKYFH